MAGSPRFSAWQWFSSENEAFLVYHLRRRGHELLLYAHSLPASPLPDDPDTPATFQSWHVFDPSSDRWKPQQTAPISTTHETLVQSTSESPAQRPPLTLVTWNVDAFAKFPDERIAAIVATLRNLTPTPNILFFQEVSRATLKHLLDDPWVRETWFSSEGNFNSYGGQAFATMTLLSKATFSPADTNTDKIAIGPVWRVKYPSKFERDALCCDIFPPSSSSSSSSSSSVSRAYSRVRLINVHLDSLPTQPSRRPRQLRYIADSLRLAGRGFVAGDFNPVLPEDDALVAGNGLVDVWDALRPGESGFTWGIDGREPFPPGRLDKVAVLGLEGSEIEVLHPDALQAGGEGPFRRTLDPPLPWSDHSGLRCCLG
ncbi:hypothetical protein BO70DRAFT_393295 [Aspergillus heteromorphus CBS 117.55]|uniref:Endonuclease/exonuclease/phosphatase domain-containing protein n=1 Tax=Aspergillus heteromorphus CBS 117.55 TaxID=1448321 RepID=A0A317WXX4_9EURO|nr:uncharacterized protein BO70DRAFT_393295 [Aspergillus heteromorphus CBS 117.55]PWY90107.1 hypothetical protein BO70DRAFT_393295 [Aspergillus heteromorphus CBS 117.55]